MDIYMILRVLLYILLAPVLGGLLSGIDRVFSARMQGRQGPPVVQPFFDVNNIVKRWGLD